jgi:outer membrane biosynthesis protein TonB
VPESREIAVPTTRQWVVAPRESAVATIYSSSDVDVQPPVMVHPSLPPTIFVARNAEAVVINRMELVIAADGSVERVRLVNGPTRMPDMMLLSGAKLWKFSPAVKDGVPVRYRTTVTWTGFP